MVWLKYENDVGQKVFKACKDKTLVFQKMGFVCSYIWARISNRAFPK